MLVLSRQRDESIVIITPDGVEIDFTTVDIRGDKVRTGVTAPKEYAVHRREVWEAIKRENLAAAAVVPAAGAVPAAEPAAERAPYAPERGVRR